VTATLVDRIMAELTAEPTYCTRDAAAFFPRSYEWFKKQVYRQGIEPIRVGRGGYFREFTLRHILDMATASNKAGGLSTEELRLVVTKVVQEIERHTGTPGLPR